jgi:hypothetical protein
MHSPYRNGHQKVAPAKADQALDVPFLVGPPHQAGVLLEQIMALQPAKTPWSASAHALAARDKFNDTPSHIAAKQGHAKLVQLFLNSNADFRATNLDGLNPLHVAVLEKHPQVVKVLIESDSDQIAGVGTEPANMCGQTAWLRWRGGVYALDRDTDHVHIGMHIDASRVRVENGHHRRWFARQPCAFGRKLALAHGVDYLVTADGK